MGERGSEYKLNFFILNIDAANPRSARCNRGAPRPVVALGGSGDVVQQVPDVIGRGWGTAPRKAPAPDLLPRSGNHRALAVAPVQGDKVVAFAKADAIQKSSLVGLMVILDTTGILSDQRQGERHK